MNSQIVRCKKCGTINHIQGDAGWVRPICGRCGASLANNSIHGYQASGRNRQRSHPAVVVVLLALLSATLYGIYLTPSLLKKDFSELRNAQERETEQLRVRNKQAITEKQAELDADLASIDAASLRQAAADQYKQEYIGRRSYDKRFALSPREKAQLHMKALASDSTKSFHDAIEAVAREASPKGADISVRESVSGVALHIDFDMSSMTSGEHGTRTKHHTKESLRKEVISLISRVTNDAFQFCKDLKLSSIHVGCRHIVQTKYPYGQTREENTMLYKIHVRKNAIRDFTSNPFLDEYSTTRHFEVDEDNFDAIEIITTRI
jgi:hypothetical protein